MSEFKYYLSFDRLAGAITKGKHFCQNTPIIMLTANAVEGSKERYLEMGFDDFLSKPIMPDLLYEMIIKYLPEEKVIFSTRGES